VNRRANECHLAINNYKRQGKKTALNDAATSSMM
jgi:hypothetical protein